MGKTRAVMVANDRYTVEAVARALEVLESFRNSESLTLAEVSDRVGLNKSRVFRMLYTLAQRGYVEKSADGQRYELGIRLLERASCVRRDLRQLALPFMRQLHEKFNETVNLAVLDNQEVLYIEMLESSRSIRMAEGIGYRSPIHATALGKVIAAYLPEVELKPILKGLSMTKFTDRTITNLARLEAELEKVRHNGYALEDRESDPEGYCIGAPLFHGVGRPGAAICVSGPTDRVVR
jgi:IclR family acetate operon transcriptional repressor